MRDNPALNEEAIITELGVGEALVSCLNEKGQPGIVERALIVPPQAQIGPITPEERKALMQNSIVAGHYEKLVDRESAYEILKGRTAEKQPATPTATRPNPPATAARSAACWAVSSAAEIHWATPRAPATVKAWAKPSPRARCAR